jgi:threonine-phosphate decarboxylase
MLLNNNQHGGNLARAAREYGLPEQLFIDFSASINPLGPSPEVYRAITENMWKISHYPDPDCGAMDGLLAAYLEVPRESIVIGNGGAELIYLLPATLKIRRALIVAPTFSEYAEAICAAGGEADYYCLPPEGDATGHLEQLKLKIPDYNAIFICNPNNPTGRLFTSGELAPLVDAADSAGTILVVDEAFIDFVDRRRECSLMPRATSTRSLIVLYSMTKFFGIPGLRLGAAVTHAGLVRAIKRTADPWRVNVLAQVAGEAALRDREHMRATMEVIRGEKDYLFAALSGMTGVRPIPGAANFLLVDLSSSGKKMEEIIPELGRRGVLVRDCSNFYGLNGVYIRIAIRTRPENDKLLGMLGEVLGGSL